MPLSPKTAPTTIVLLGDPMTKERIATGAITPGWLLEREAVNDGVQAHSTAGGDAAAYVAIENPAQSEAAGFVDYADGDRCYFAVGKPGDEFYMIAASGNDVTYGDILESDGNGLLQLYTAQAVDEGGTATYTVYLNAARFMALEDVDASTADLRIRVEVL
jgi:hypothetical protein